MASIYRRTYRDADGKSRECGSFSVEFRFGERAIRLAAFDDRRASDDLARKIERLAELRSVGDEPDAALRRFLDGLPERIRSRLIKHGLISGRAASGTRNLSAHLGDYHQALLDGVA